MKTILISLFTVMVSLSVFAAETVITGAGSNTVGIGTFQVTSDGTSATLTVDKLIALNSATIATTNGALITGNIPVASITNALTTGGASIGGNIPVAAITNALAGTAYTTNTLTGDGVTNVFIWNTVGGVKVLKSITTTP